MAKDDAWKRFRDREDEEEEEELDLRSRRMGTTAAPTAPASKTKTVTPHKTGVAGGGDKFDELMQRSDTMIDQLNNLYNMFASGAERIPPTERRKQLDQNMLTLQAMSKPTPAMQFKFSNMQSRYSTHCERWDKLMRDIENGKIKRTVGPLRKAS